MGKTKVEKQSFFGYSSRVCGVSNKIHEVPVVLGTGPRKMLSENMMFQNVLATEHSKLLVNRFFCVFTISMSLKIVLSLRWIGT